MNPACRISSHSKAWDELTCDIRLVGPDAEEAIRQAKRLGLTPGSLIQSILECVFRDDLTTAVLDR